jgi:KUP system potassium uptake protein
MPEAGRYSRRDDKSQAGRVALVVGALGVVFGDIGTSPLYALEAVFTSNHHSVHPTQASVYGVISLVFWALTLVVTVKYVTFIMRADNDGEGGIMALIALVRSASPRRRRVAVGLVAVGVFGAALFYGDGTITPAISVLSAIEGMTVVSPSLDSYAVPIAVAVLTVLFAVQRFGTGTVGQLFGPVMGLWFAALALLGLRQVSSHPDVLKALSPSYGLTFLVDHFGVAFIALASIVLVVTGAEALYADIGHFGRRPIRAAWFLIVFPALTLNYLGQGALILNSHAAIRNPFFLMTPHWARIPMVVLATVATVIASQAVISGAFSISHQATQLGFLPRLTIRHTSPHEAGQVYAPAINWLLYAAVAALVIGFGSSVRLAGAYGIAVTGTMITTTILFLWLVRTRWKKSPWITLGGAALFLTVDLTLFSASLTKVAHGGWIPLSIAAAVFTILTTWDKGREIVTRNRIEQEGPLRGFVEELHAMEPSPHRAPGTAVFLNARPDTTPLALRANVEHNHVIHSSVIIVTIETLNVPHIAPADRLEIDDLGYRNDGITHVTARYGFHDRQNVPRALASAEKHGLERASDLQRCSYFVSRIAIVVTGSRVMSPWRKKLFRALWRNQADPIEYFGLPDERTVTMGSPIEL